MLPCIWTSLPRCVSVPNADLGSPAPLQPSLKYPQRLGKLILDGLFADLHACRDLSGAQSLDSAELEDNPAALGEVVTDDAPDSIRKERVLRGFQWVCVGGWDGSRDPLT